MGKRLKQFFDLHTILALIFIIGASIFMWWKDDMMTLEAWFFWYWLISVVVIAKIVVFIKTPKE